MTKEKVISELISKRNKLTMETPFIAWEVVYNDALEEAFLQRLSERIGTAGVSAFLETLDEYNLTLKL